MAASAAGPRGARAGPAATGTSRAADSSAARTSTRCRAATADPSRATDPDPARAGASCGSATAGTGRAADSSPAGSTATAAPAATVPAAAATAAAAAAAASAAASAPPAASAALGKGGADTPGELQRRDDRHDEQHECESDRERSRRMQQAGHANTPNCYGSVAFTPGCFDCAAPSGGEQSGEHSKAPREETCGRPLYLECASGDNRRPRGGAIWLATGI
jgi:hypothetical protein